MFSFRSCQPVTLVSGLPRSGTSLMMRMLETGGMPVLIDAERGPDEDNPRGYYEYAPVLRTRKDASWLGLAQGKAVKIVYKLLYHLPAKYRYRVVMMRRNLSEVIASQNKMLRRLGEPVDDDPQLAEVYRDEMNNVSQWTSTMANFQMLNVDYNDLLVNAQPQLDAVASFLARPLDVKAMCDCVDGSLYRQRRSQTEPTS